MSALESSPHGVRLRPPTERVAHMAIPATRLFALITMRVLHICAVVLFWTMKLAVQGSVLLYKHAKDNKRTAVPDRQKAEEEEEEEAEEDDAEAEEGEESEESEDEDDAAQQPPAEGAGAGDQRGEGAADEEFVAPAADLAFPRFSISAAPTKNALEADVEEEPQPTTHVDRSAGAASNSPLESEESVTASPPAPAASTSSRCSRSSAADVEEAQSTQHVDESPAAPEEVIWSTIVPAEESATAPEESSQPSPSSSSRKSPAAKDLVLRMLRTPHASEAPLLRAAAADKAAAKLGVQVRLQAAASMGASSIVAVLGDRESTGKVCEALQRDGPCSFEEDLWDSFFLLRFGVREAVDAAPHDEELLDASLENDWIDLGGCGDDATQKEQRREASSSQSSLQALLRTRLHKVLPQEEAGLSILMDSGDEKPGSASAGRCTKVDFVGVLRPESWAAATKAVLSCEAAGVYLSRTYSAYFSCPEEPLSEHVQSQVTNCLSHWKGQRTETLPGTDGACLGVDDLAYACFEDLSANVSAVLLGKKPPGWYRLEWTPSGVGAVPYKTY
eukprot:TRINITY_DN14514_c0_g1_i1.p1 TRINITY_DN14514_c0_g1~~TRINITY_DN14514_c0_g1_i1.p1  ORF type:complete len:597 (-),score=151.68 TRINITY_DN14514_c0_g1_i1:416-2098(-)